MSEALLFAEHGENMLCTKIVLNFRNNLCTQPVLPRFELGIFMYWTCNSMNNLSSYFGLIDAKIRAFDKYLPVSNAASHMMVLTFILSNFPPVFFFYFQAQNPSRACFLHILVKNAKTV